MVKMCKTAKRTKLYKDKCIDKTCDDRKFAVLENFSVKFDQ